MKACKRHIYGDHHLFSVMTWLFSAINSQCIVYSTEYIFYCKRAILFLSSSKILTPIPLSPRRVCPPPATKAGGTHSPGGEGDGGSIFWKTREIGLPSYSNGLSTVYSIVHVSLSVYTSSPNLNLALRTEPVLLNVYGGPGIDSKEWILPAYVAWRAGTIALFLLRS